MIGNVDMGKALCDSGTSIMGELTPTAITLQMANRTLAHPEGLLEYVLIKVGKFVFPMDFIVINIEEDKQIPLLLGRPFLATGAPLIDVKKRELTLKVGDEAVHFNLNDSLNQPELRSVECECLETKVPVSYELTIDYNFQNSMNENEMNFQYLEHLEVEFLNSNFKRKTQYSVLERTSNPSGYDIWTFRVHFITCMTCALAERG